MNSRNQGSITVNREPLEDADKFHYLGGIGSNVGGGTIDLDYRLAKAIATFLRLRNIWNSSNITQHTKLMLFKTW